MCAPPSPPTSIVLQSFMFFLFYQLVCFLVMVKVYSSGLHPVTEDGNKVIEWYERALLLDLTNEDKLKVYLGTLYDVNIHNTPGHATPFLYPLYLNPICLLMNHMFMLTSSHQSCLYLSISNLLALGDIYKKGITSVSQDGRKALDYYECALELEVSEFKKMAIHTSTLSNSTSPPLVICWLDPMYIHIYILEPIRVLLKLY